MKIFAKDWGESGIRFFKVPNRLYNLLLSVDDYQGDRAISLTITLFQQAVQVRYWFHDEYELIPLFDWRLCK